MKFLGALVFLALPAFADISWQEFDFVKNKVEHIFKESGMELREGNRDEKGARVRHLPSEELLAIVRTPAASKLDPAQP